MTNVWRILALGGSVCRILRCLEAPGGPLEAGSDVGESGGWKSLELEVWSSSVRIRGLVIWKFQCLEAWRVWKFE